MDTNPVRLIRDDMKQCGCMGFLTWQDIAHAMSAGEVMPVMVTLACMLDALPQTGMLMPA